MIIGGWKVCRGSRWALLLVSAAVSAALSGCHAAAQDPLNASTPRADIPIRRVVLYQNGVGYFEREGRIDGNLLTLQIRPSQVNDLLKSLTIIDRSSGRAVSVSLPLEKSGDRMLAELPPQVRQAEGLLGVLSVFRGARVSVKTSKSRGASGRIVGVENLQQAQGEKVLADWRLTIRTDEGTLRVFRVKHITEVAIQDRTLSVGLQQSLDVSLNEGSWKSLTLAVRLAGDEEHDVRASYIVEMPRWKPAYRIIAGTTKPLLQGWAVIDNVSGEDWRDVKLSLVSGSPMSFIYDLHSPQYTERQDLTPRRAARALAPPEESVGVLAESKAEALSDEEMASFEAPMAEAAAIGPPLPVASHNNSRKRMPMKAHSKKRLRHAIGAADFGLEDSKEAAEPELDELLEAQTQASTSGQQVSSLFRYDLADRVTVPDRSSTLVAIVNERVDAEEVAYFRPESSAAGHHPYRAMRLTNNTTYSLEKGPVTLYSGDTFVGEGFLSRAEPGSTQFISFSIDNKLTLSADSTTKEEEARLLRIVDGLIYSELQRSEITTYVITSLDTKAVTAYVRTPKRPGWKLDKAIPGTIELPDALVLPLVVPASGKASLAISWKKALQQTVGLDTSLSSDLLTVYLKGGQASPALAAQLRAVLAIKQELDTAKKKDRRLRRQHSELSQEQARVRANLNTLRKTKGNQALQRRLAIKLGTLETELGRLSGQRVELSESVAALETRLKVAFSGITLSKSN